ncbi:MAG: hypothetical protein UIB40_03620 [Paludibacteraceae bacterium]|jgi:hypothetical protein|nr:hypothetical protein [Paludibacteraceae bacterium]
MKKFFILAVCFAAVVFASCEPALLPNVKAYGFSVSSTKKVVFSPGNLQYDRMSRTWSFAENQYDALGANNVKNGALADKIDLFGWSGSNSAVLYGVNLSDNALDYAGEFVDWGNNQIGKDAPDTWRTLSFEEYDYLIHKRPNAAQLKGVAEVNGVNGLILLPDEWVCPTGLVFKSGFASSDGEEYFAKHQSFTAAEWLEMEHAGAVFLPAAGYRYKNKVYDVYVKSYYWTSTNEGDKHAYLLTFSSYMADFGWIIRYVGQPVRLVKDL